jgi:hypothetical protein
MLKDVIMKSYRMLKKENDSIPLGVRGELEVIVRDKDRNIISYDIDHNEITDWMKHAIVHLLAGDILSEEHKEPTDGTSVSGFSTPLVSPYNVKFTNMQANDGVNTFHDLSTLVNKDGMLLSNRPYYHNGLDDASFLWRNFEENRSSYVSPMYPTKMLFGTGKEISMNDDYSTLTALYGTDDPNTLKNFLGIESMDETSFATWKANINIDSNYYSGTSNLAGTNIIKARTVQPPHVYQEAPEEPNYRGEFGIKGAIKTCLIESATDETTKYDFTNEIASGENRGLGRPCFVYAQRDDSNFHTESVIPGYTHIGKNSATVYEDKFTYSVIMPQTSGSNFYPYNGWVLKEAGLFSDSILRLGTSTDGYEKMPSGILLAKRYIKPVMKTADTEIEFRWSIYIAESSV